MKWEAKWVKPGDTMTDAAPRYVRNFSARGRVRFARLFITAMGVYEAKLNGQRVGRFVLAPGWTAYYKRLQYQEYDVTELIEQENQLAVIVGKGWYHSPMLGYQEAEYQRGLAGQPLGLLAQLEIAYEDGGTERILSDQSWLVSESRIRFSEIYDGEVYDGAFQPGEGRPASVFDGPFHTLVPQQGEEIREQERIGAASVFTTPKGEVVVDFGQEITGYVEISVKAEEGERIAISHGEVLDQKGNFYTENYRSAKAKYECRCRQGFGSYHARLTFFGFRYIRVDAFPGGKGAARPEQFTAIVLHSQMKRTGYLACSDSLLNRLFHNIVWGQKGNFLDVPTDCPQRNERLGWTGDAQVFVRTACYQFDVERFFRKWLSDLAADQREDGCVGQVIPDLLQRESSSAAWGDAAVICPWTVYQAYGDPGILAAQWDSMCGWVNYITSHTKVPGLWIGGTHHGDWLGLDAPAGSYKGSSREDFIASAFYAYSTSLLVRAGRVLGKEVSRYERLYEIIVAAFQNAYPDYKTQTECVLAARFRLARNCQAAADQLAERIQACGGCLQTGFVGTPYLLSVLSDYGYTKLAYTLLLRRQYPSWLYPVTKGATTVWEHWDGIMENGAFWSSDMNSFNHYAYGAVADWVYGTAAGITTNEAFPGYEKVRIAPRPDSRLDWLRADLHTRHGHISSEWRKQDSYWRYEITTPVEAELVIGGKTIKAGPGSYCFYQDVCPDGQER